MKYPARQYAHALVAALHENKKTGVVAEGLMKVLKRNGDTNKLPEIVARTEELWNAHTGTVKVEIETARPNKAIVEKVKRVFAKGKFEERIVPELLAGVRLRINNERIIDASGKRMIDSLF